MNVAAIIIGDELLSGKRQDKHLQSLIRILAARGLSLAAAEYVGDDPARITAALQRAFASGELVFSFGGIGATPDDHTRSCAGALIEARFGEEACPHRINMAMFPSGSRIIPNPVNQIAGFSHGDVHFVPGFPAMAWPMIEWVLDSQYRHLFNDSPDVEAGVIALNAREGDLITLMQDFSQRYPALKLSSLPSFGSETLPQMHIAFGFTGPRQLVEIAIAEWRQALTAAGYTLRERS